MKKEPYIIGRVIWYNLQKGYGFIGSRNGNVFVHYSAITADDRNLRPGQTVKYRVEESAKGLCATDCQPLRNNYRR